MLITDVPQVQLDHGTDRARPIGEMTAAQARRYAAQHQFAAGSMGPKVEAAIGFVERGGRADDNADLQLRVLHIRAHRRFVVFRGHRAVARGPELAEAHRDHLTLHRLIAAAHRHHDASPVRVLAGDRRFHQRAFANRARDDLRARIVRRAFDRNADKFRRAFAVPHDLDREIAQHLESAARNPSSRASFASAIGGTRAWPVANSSTQSFVLRSPSTVIELKLVSVSAFSNVFRIGADSAASVNTNASIVAMFGAIMPEPLAMPAMFTATPSIVHIAPAPLANVSVVMIAAAASGHGTGPERHLHQRRRDL